MTSPLRGRRVAFLERAHPPGYEGAVADKLVPLLRSRGALVDVVEAEHGAHRVDEPPPWELAVLKSGSAAALHLAAAAAACGVPVVNSVAATRLAQDKLASTAMLQRAGLPIAPGRIAWLGPDLSPALARRAGDRPLAVKAVRGSRGTGLWMIEAGALAALAATLPPAPYLLMERVPHRGPDLKVFVAGGWAAAVERVFPALTAAEKRGRPARLPREVEDVTRAAGSLLGLSCFGCDFVRGPGRWTLVDVNAFPGYKGAAGAADALVAEIERFAAEAA